MTTPMSTLPRYYRRLVKETAQAAYRKGVEEGQRLATSAVLAGMFEGLNGDGERVALKALTSVVAKSKDAAGHEHRGSGPGGGQFVGQGSGGSGDGNDKSPDGPLDQLHPRIRSKYERLLKRQPKELHGELLDKAVSEHSEVAARNEKLRATAVKAPGSHSPLIVYHGTESDFDTFADRPTFFTPSGNYGFIRDSATVHAAYLDIRNPYYTDVQREAEAATYGGGGEFVRELQAKGYDGLIYSKPGDITKGATGWGDDHPQYIAFRGEQIVPVGKYDRDEFDSRYDAGEFDPAGPVQSEALADFHADTVEKSWTESGHSDYRIHKAWQESDHPRGDDGRFISADEIEAAKGDAKAAASLRSRVTDPEQRAKLEKHLGNGEASPEAETSPPPAGPQAEGPSSPNAHLPGYAEAEAAHDAKGGPAKFADLVAGLRAIGWDEGQVQGFVDAYRPKAQGADGAAAEPPPSSAPAPATPEATAEAPAAETPPASPEPPSRKPKAKPTSSAPPSPVRVLTDAEALGEPWESVGVHGSKGEAEKQARDIQGAVTRVGRKWHAMRRFEPKPGGGAAGKSPPSSAYGTPGTNHPLAGKSPAEQRKLLADAIGRADRGESNVLGHESGPPDGLDMASFSADVRGVVGRHVAAVSVGPDIASVYAAVGPKYGLSKQDFNRAIVAAHDGDSIRLGGWPKGVHDLPDPELTPMVSSKLMGYVHHPSGANIGAMAAEGDASLNTSHPAVRGGGSSPVSVSPSTIASTGRSLPDWAGNAHDPGAPHVGHKVFISDLHERLAPGMSLDEFKDHLEKTYPHALSRIDMSELASDPDKLDASETRRGSHVVDVTRLR